MSAREPRSERGENNTRSWAEESIEGGEGTKAQSGSRPVKDNPDQKKLTCHRGWGQHSQGTIKMGLWVEPGKRESQVSQAPPAAIIIVYGAGIWFPHILNKQNGKIRILATRKKIKN